MGSERGQLLRGEGGLRVPMRRRRHRPGEIDEEEAQGISLALERPTDARGGDIVSLQRLAGNDAVVQLTGHGAGPEVEVNPPEGAYTGPRRRNDKMDWFADRQNVFGPATFREYGAYPDLWAPLDRLIETYWVRNRGSDAGITLRTTDERIGAWVVIERFNAAKAADIRQRKAGRWRDAALLDAIWGEFDKQYAFAHRRCHAAWWHSNFRLKHEWLAVRFGRVQPPYAYWARRRA